MVVTGRAAVELLLHATEFTTEKTAARGIGKTQAVRMVFQTQF